MSRPDPNDALSFGCPVCLAPPNVPCGHTARAQLARAAQQAAPIKTRSRRPLWLALGALAVIAALLVLVATAHAYRLRHPDRERCHAGYTRHSRTVVEHHRDYRVRFVVVTCVKAPAPKVSTAAPSKETAAPAQPSPVASPPPPVAESPIIEWVNEPESEIEVEPSEAGTTT